MADNFTLNAGSSGVDLWTDELATPTRHAQYVKLADGTADGATVVATGVGDAANGLRVALGSSSTIATTNAGTFAVQAAQAGTWNITNVSGTVSLPTGAATAAKQPALGTAGSAASDVISVQGIASMTALTVDGSGVTQPVSGTVTANAGTGTMTVDGSGVTQPVSNAGLTELAGAINASSQMECVLVAGTGTNIGSVSLSVTDNTVLDNIDTQTTPGASHYRNIDANAEAEIKSSAGTLYWLHAMNMTAAVAYLHLYDGTAASVTPGTTTPTYTFPLATQGDTNGAGFAMPVGANGQAFASGIVLVCTTTTDGSAGDPGTNGVFVNAGYT